MDSCNLRQFTCQVVVCHMGHLSVCTRQGEAEGRPTWDMTMKYAAIGKWRMPGGAECQACQTCHVGLYLGYLGLNIGVCLKDLKEPRNLGNSMIFFSLVLFLYLLLGFLGTRVQKSEMAMDLFWSTGPDGFR